MVDDKTIDAASKFVQTLNDVFGPSGIWVLMILVFLGAIAFKFYNDYQRNKREQGALDAKQQTIDVLVDQNRDLRVVIAKKEGWSDETINQLILQNSSNDALEAQRLLVQLEDERPPAGRLKRPTKDLEEK